MLFSILSTGMALLELAFRAKDRCVINSEWMGLGYTRLRVVSRTPAGEMWSATISAEILVTLFLRLTVD